MTTKDSNGVRHLPASELQRDTILQEILDNIGQYQNEFGNVDFGALREDVIKKVLNDNFDPEVQTRGFLRAFRNTTTFKAAFEHIRSQALRDRIEKFVDGIARSRLSKLTVDAIEVADGVKDDIKAVFASGDHKDEKVQISKNLKELPIVYEDKERTKVMGVYSNVPFENWGGSVQNSPRNTFLPTTVLGIQNLVLYASEKGFRVRCAGYRHSWSSTFSQDNKIFLSFVDLYTVTTLPDPLSIISEPYDVLSTHELKRIELKDLSSNSKRLCRVGVAVSNQEFRRWAVSNGAWALPVDVILVEVTIGGVNGPICHGAGIKHQTISDYVRRIEYVDCNGNLQVVSDTEQLKAAAGCFGLLGVVTHVTFELDAMTYAVMEPRKVDIGLAIPPPTVDDIPQALRSDHITATELESANQDFERRAAESYYSEWFWFTYQKKAWVNTWDTTTDPTGLTDYPNDALVFLQWIENWIGGVITSHRLFQIIPGYWQAQPLATLGMSSLSPTLGEDKTPTFKTMLPNGLHFRRGIQNMRVRDMEFEIPLPPTHDDPLNADYCVVQKACYAQPGALDPSSPMRLTLELRITGGSNLHMAPQNGNDLGTASIKVLSIPDAVTDGEWDDFCDKVAQLWLSYGVNVRPHWAREWERVKFNGMDAREPLKKVAYKDQIPAFKSGLEIIGFGQGWDLVALQTRFSNELWDKLVFED